MKIAALLSAALLVAAPARAADLTRVTGAEVVAFLQEQGARAALDTDSEGDPMVRAELEGRAYQVLFYDCEEHTRCGAIQFRTWWSEHRGVSLDKINEYNRTRRLGRAYRDADGDPTLEVVVFLSGGVSPAWLRDQHRIFQQAMISFKEYLR